MKLHDNPAMPVGPNLDIHVGPLLPQPRDQIFQILVGSQRRVGCAVPQRNHHHLARLGIGDDPWEVLVLFVAAVEERQLLRAMRGSSKPSRSNVNRPGSLSKDSRN